MQVNSIQEIFLNFLSPAIAEEGLNIDWDDEVFKGANITRNGEVTLTKEQIDMETFIAIYIFMLAAFTGFEVISKVLAILHTPLMSGSNFIHGVVLVGAIIALGMAETNLEKSIGFLGVLLASGNAVGGYVVTERMLEMFKSKKENE